jgi:hypothetical protein
LQFPCRAAPQQRPVCTKRRHVSHFYSNSDLHPYDVDKGAASRCSQYRQLEIGQWQLDLWHRLN